jgi:uncharacterized protein YkwD
VHHRPVGPPLSARLRAATMRRLLLARRSLSARLTVAVLLCAVVTTLVLAVPVVSGVRAGSPEVTLGASSSSASRESGSPVIMGLDGGAVPSSTFAGTSTDAPRREQSATAPETTGAAPTASSTPPAPVAPVVVPEPVPSETEEAKSAAPPVAAAAPAAPEPTASPAPTAAVGREDEVLALVNAARATTGCAPLVADAGLAGVARAHSEDMRDRDFFDHVNPDGLDPFERAEQAGQTDVQAENIAHGRSTAAAVMEDWMDSSEHRENILDCELRTLGVGIADGPGGPWWTQLLGD